MGIELFWGPVVFISFMWTVGFILSKFIPEPKIYFYEESGINNLPANIKSKTTTKMRWAKRTQDNNSFANGIMWADLGND